MFLGENLMLWLLLAFGGALAAGHIAALVRPRPDMVDGELERPPFGRSLVMIVAGLVVAIWSLASLIDAA